MPVLRLFVPAPLSAVALGAVLSVSLLVGCDSAPEKPNKAAAAPPTAEERFALIVQALERQLENSNLNAPTASADYNAPPGVPVTAAKVEVTEKLVPPAGDGEPYRASICLSTESKVTVVMPQPTDEEQDEARAKRKEKLEELEGELEGVGDLDMLVTPGKEGIAGLGSPGVQEFEADTSKTCFDLEFRDGRWELLTELDRENQPFYALAIEYALKKQ